MAQIPPRWFRQVLGTNVRVSAWKHNTCDDFSATPVAAAEDEDDPGHAATNTKAPHFETHEAASLPL